MAKAAGGSPTVASGSGRSGRATWWSGRIASLFWSVPLRPVAWKCATIAQHGVAGVHRLIRAGRTAAAFNVDSVGAPDTVIVTVIDQGPCAASVERRASAFHVVQCGRGRTALARVNREVTGRQSGRRRRHYPSRLRLFLIDCRRAATALLQPQMSSSLTSVTTTPAVQRAGRR